LGMEEMRIGLIAFYRRYKFSVKSSEGLSN